MTPPRKSLWRKFEIALVTASAVGLLSGLILVATPAIATSTTTTTSSTTTTAPGATTTTTAPGTTTTTTTITIPSTTTTTAPGTTTTTTTTPTSTTTTTLPTAPTLAWPQVGSAAIAVPQLSVVAASPHQPREAIASLTKMMTAWVALHQMPVGTNQRGRCLTVNSSDVAIYDQDVDVDLSSDKIVTGETLCESTLLRGLFVHSSSDYAQLLAAMTGMSSSAFINLMNKDALELGMKQTHYVDVTGLSPGDLSTAQDQATLTVNLMSDEPVVRSIVALTKVDLPVVGVVTSYTPFIGRAGVVGVKSGITTAAGGCDVMAIANQIGDTTIMTYAVVLGQRAGDPLTSAGIAALALSRTIRSSIARVRSTSGVQIDWIGATTDVVPTPATK